MSIWNYAIMPSIIDENTASLRQCLFCHIPLELLKLEKAAVGSDLSYNHLNVSFCQQCGWWNAKHTEKYRCNEIQSHQYSEVGYAILKQLDVSDVSVPIQEIRDFLTVKYNSVKSIHPRLYEEVVGSVFRDLGYSTIVTNYSNDKGIDVILHDSQSRLIGVQVKRYNNSIKAEQIRELTGALFLGGFTKGIFVTTSNFQAGASATANLSAAKGIPIELMDSDRFFDALQMAQLKVNRREIAWEQYNLKSFKTIDDATFTETYYLK